MRTPDTPRFPVRTLRSFGALLLLAGLVAACGGGGGGGGGGAPVSPFVVTTVTPADGANGVETNVHVFVTFSLPVAPASVTASSIGVGNTENGGIAGTVGLVSDGLGTTCSSSRSPRPCPPRRPGASWSPPRSAPRRATRSAATARSSSAPGPAAAPILPPASALQPTTGRLQQGRRNHTSTLLATGGVLVAGGFIQGTTVTDRAETFAPGTQTFTSLTPRMKHPRASHTATRLTDGRVLLAGGYYEINPGTINVTPTAEVYDPVANTFTTVGAMGTPRVDHAALLLPDGRVLITGGSELQGSFLSDHASVEVFDPSTGQFSPWPVPMNHTRATHAMLDLFDGRWLLVGGSDTDLRPETFSTTTGLFTLFAGANRTARGRRRGRDVPLGERLGGRRRGPRRGPVLRQRDDLAHQHRQRDVEPPLLTAPRPRSAPGRILVAGGIDFSNGSFILATCDLVVEGGVAGSETYATAVRFPTGMANHTATVLGDGRILYCGGLNPTGGQAERDGAYLFTP